MVNSCFVSFVIAARNDNFGRGFLRRVQACVNSIVALGQKYGLDYELVIVEWNPPADNAGLKDAIRWPILTNGRVRIVEVPSSVHQKFPNADKIPYFEFLAKNTGIRRAQGEYVVAMNSDLVLSEELVEYLASSKSRFSRDAFYRAVRVDILGDVPIGEPVERQVQFCKDHIYRIQGLHGEFPVDKKEYFKMRIYERFFWFKWSNAVKKLKKIFVKETPKPAAPHEKKVGFLYIHAGDFMMMARDQWFKFNGYPEVGVDRGIDCYMVIMSHIAGMMQVILPYPVYHQEHNRTPQKTRPTAVLENIPAFQKMIKEEEPVLVNGENWGLGDLSLKETNF